ncbi:DUF2484 family protein [Paracoccus cavernae]|uniref:DUF2484 family protein n=1 Tax=Paracoccus cavernae TaxID=1571207 RepID=A0ABT8D661_9RHOB|nr:DUF2484 family protein [Paracoccus cavernae]
MTALAAQPYAGEAALLMVVIWAVAASLVPFLRLRWRATAFGSSSRSACRRLAG